MVRHPNSTGQLATVRTAISRSLNPGDPKRLDQLRIEARGASRAVIVELGEEVTAVTVESTDAAWALGRAEQIRRILWHAGGSSERQRWRPWLWAVTSGAAIAGGLALVWLFGVTMTIALSVALVGGVAAAGFLVARRMVSKSQPTIWIDGAMPRHGWRGWSLGDRIAFLALLVAFLAAVVPLLMR